MGEDALQAERSSVAGLHESQDLVVPSPSPARSSPAHSLSRAAGGGTASSRAGEGQVHAITVLTLLDKLVNMLDTVQENQLKIERRQAGLELAVRGVQNDVIKLSKNHTSTSNTVSKLLEKSRKVSLHSREVRDRMDRQAEQVKRLEASHAHLLKRNNFKVLIFQEEKEIPASVFVKDPAPLPCEAMDEVPVDTNRSQEEALHTIELSSDEEPEPDREEEEAELADEHLEKSRAERIKRSSLKKVDSLKKAFSRQNIEKKMNKIGSKIVSPEKREKIKKSLSHSGKSPSLKLPPLTFGIGKKGKGGESTSQEEATPTVDASIELAPVNSLGEEEEPSKLVECKAEADSVEKEEVPSPSASGVDDESSVKEDEIPEGTLSTPLSQEDPALPSTPQPQKQEEEVEPEKEEEKEELIQENESHIEEEVEKDLEEERESVTDVEKADEDKENPKEEMMQEEQENDGGANAPEKESHAAVEEMEHSQENSEEEKETHEEADQEGEEEKEEEKVGKVEVEEKKDGDLNVEGEEETPVVVEKEAVEEQNPHKERMSPVEAPVHPDSLMVQQSS
ncbi:caveolae-associated protein 2-like [Megalops cyprinoides]|uniref:caveolae-associated protein 2-like n=1 Tax=Megalops cyprinoides TaxID=118141 RepID=UPI001863D828|nr:caveolae-associated protein 2-like [Megalops cyprinoides]